MSPLFAEDVSIPSTGSFTTYTTVSRHVTFGSAGPKTIRLKFQQNASNGVAAQVDHITFAPVDLSLMGPFAPLTTPATVAAQGKTQVGTTFAVNAPGTINQLRFYVNSDELLFSKQTGTSHVVNLWRINSSGVVS